MNDMDETWRVITDFPDYAVSSLGRIKRLTSRTHAKAGHILRAGLGKKGRYWQVTLCRDGKVTTKTVHGLVAAAFIGDRPFPEAHINHIDGDRSNNCAKNLEYTTCSENHKHAYRIGLSNAKGEHNGQSKFTAEMVLLFRMEAPWHGRGYYLTKAREIGVSPTAIRDAVVGRTWPHLSFPEVD